MYPQIYTLVFNEFHHPLDGNCPSVVYIGYDRNDLDGVKVMGFMSGYNLSPNTFYLQRAGFIKKEQYSPLNFRRMMEGINILHKEFPYIMTLINSDDVHALKIALKAGFKIVGTRVDSQNRVLVEMMKDGMDVYQLKFEQPEELKEVA
jgi:hypothetical protein